jgi:hypothetical protein
MELTELTINNIPYISIESFIDNQDGIDAYMPEEDSLDIWFDFLQNSESLIALWSLGALHYYEDMTSEFRSALVQSGGQELITFLKKYYWDLDLDDIFIDFNFGQYAPHNLKDNFPSIFYQNKLIKQEWFEFNNDVFIEAEKFEEFEIDLYNVILVIKRNMNI